MTTRPKGITLPSYSNVQFLSNGLLATDTAFIYSGNNVYVYGPLGVIPLNVTALASTIPSSLKLSAQNAVASASSVGGAINVVPGIGSNSNASGNLVLADTSGAGGAWNTSHYVMGAYHLWVDAKFRLRIKNAAPANDTDGNAVGLDLSATGAYTPGTIATLASTSTTIAVAGAVLGDLAICSFSLDTTGLIVTARVSAAGTVSVIMYNPTGASITPGAGTLAVKVIKV